MKSTVAVQVDADAMLRLISHLKVRGGAQDVTAAIDSAIALWLREQSQLPFDCDPANPRGYQWKTLFLPDGTEIRSWSYGEHNYARVVGDDIIHKGKPVTPNEFAQSCARSMRNAWLDLSVRRPQDQQFQLAHRLRQELAQQAVQAPPARRDSAAAPADLGPLLAALQAQLPPAPPAASAPAATIPRGAQPGPPRPLPRGPGWDLPERRQYRFRLEDVAFD